MNSGATSLARRRQNMKCQANANANKGNSGLAQWCNGLVDNNGLVVNTVVCVGMVVVGMVVVVTGVVWCVGMVATCGVVWLVWYKQNYEKQIRAEELVL